MKSRTKKIDKNLVEGLPEGESLQTISDKTDVFFSYSHRLDGKTVRERNYIGTVKDMKFVPNDDYIDQKPIKSERPLNNRTHEKKRKIEEEHLAGSAQKSSPCVTASVAIGFAEDELFGLSGEVASFVNRGSKESSRNPDALKETSETASIWKRLELCKTKAASEIPLYNAIAEETGLKEDLTAVWGEDKATAAISIASHWLNTGSNAAYLYESWAQNKFVPYPEAITSKQMSELFRELKNTSNWRKDFFGARIKRLQDKEMLSFDATQIASQATEISYAQYGVGKEGGYQRQVGLIILVGHQSHTPVLFRILPGNITDVTTVQDMLFRFDEFTDSRRIFGAVVDRGYFSLANLARFSDAGSRIVMAAKTDAFWIRNAIEEAMPHLWTNAARIAGDKCWGKTIAVEPTFEDGKKRRLWVHVYRTDGKAEQENSAFYEGLEAFEKQWIHWRPRKGKDENAENCALRKSLWMKYFEKDKGIPGQAPLVQNDAAIDAATRYFGIFCNVTTMECTAKETLSTYRARDLIEKTFKGGKTNFELGVIRSHDDDTMEGRFIIGFVALTILSNLYYRMKSQDSIVKTGGEKKALTLAEEMTFNELKNRFMTPRIIFDKDGKGHWLEVTKRQHEIAARLGFPDLYKTVPDWK